MNYDIGTRYGKLTIISKTQKKMQLQCDCGKVLTYGGQGLKGKLKSYSYNLDLVSCQTCTKKLFREIQNNSPAYKAKKVIVSYKHSAKQRGIDYNLTSDTVENLIFKPCFYCGATDSNFYTSRKGGVVDFAYNGMDRVDPTLGYTKDNIVPCCKQCNISKMSYSKEEFLLWIKKVHDKMFNDQSESS